MANMPKGETLTQIKLRAQAREHEEKAKAELRHSALVLMLDHFAKQGYVQTLERLEAESGVSLKRFAAADNMDFAYILQEFSEFYNMKYARKPKLIRRITQADSDKLKHQREEARKKHRFPSIAKRDAELPNPGYGDVDNKEQATVVTHNRYADSRSGGRRNRRSSSNKGAKADSDPGNDMQISGASSSSSLPPRSSTPRSKSNKSSRRRRDSAQNSDSEKGDDLGIGVSGNTVTMNEAQGKKVQQESKQSEDPVDGWFEHRLLKPMPEFGNKQLAQLASVIQSEIHQRSPNVRWTDIAELESAKELLKEAVVMPMKYPQFFTGLLQPWKGVLLYGPPGTGKTMLARAVATECKTTFFNISASSIVSKYRGESEKLVRCLFDLARYHAPSTIFIDELDSVMGQRKDDEHEGSRRLKTELLIQMDGLNKTDDLVFVLAASNLPWVLDQAILRRLEKRIWIPLPTVKARRIMVAHHLTSERAEGLDFQAIAEATEGYSGSDIFLLCKEAAMRPMRRLMRKLKAFDDDDPDGDVSDVKVDKLTQKDVDAALKMVKCSASNKEFLKLYSEFTSMYGAGFSAEEDDESGLDSSEGVSKSAVGLGV